MNVDPSIKKAIHHANKLARPSCYSVSIIIKHLEELGLWIDVRVSADPTNQSAETMKSPKWKMEHHQPIRLSIISLAYKTATAMTCLRPRQLVLG
jgi:hypothetical protein